MHSYCLPFLDGSTKHDDSPIVGDRDDCITHSDGHNQMTTEGSKEGCERLSITTQKMVHFYKKWLQQAREYVLI